MTGAWRRRFRNVIGLAVVVGLFHLANEGAVVRAAPAPSELLTIAASALRSTDGLCEEECGPSISCDQGCWSWAPELPLFHTTCGEYAGGSQGGWCLGDCGDSFCNEYNDEDPDTCYIDCGECGDNVCTAEWENAASCYEDCGTCGDGICSPDEACGGSAQCPTDCGSCGSTGSECSELYSDCGSELRCNAQHYCVSPGNKECFDAHGCCYNEVWLEMDCSWEYLHHGQAAGEACELQHCMPNLGCGECIPMGPMIPRLGHL